MTLEEMVQKLKREGKSVAEITKILRDQNFGVSNVEVKIIYNKV